MAIENKITSRYVTTPIKDFYLDLWNPIIILPTADDTDVIIRSKYHERPDLMSYDIYGTSRLWWVFALRNMDVLIDPINDFKSGIIISVPAMQTVERLI